MLKRYFPGLDIPPPRPKREPEGRTLYGMPVILDESLPDDIIRLVSAVRGGVDICELNMSKGTITKIEKRYEYSSRSSRRHNPPTGG